MLIAQKEREAYKIIIKTLEGMGYKRPIQLYISADKNGSASIDDYYSISNEAVFAPSLKFFSKKNPTLDVAEIRAVTNATATAPDITQSEH